MFSREKSRRIKQTPPPSPRVSFYLFIFLSTLPRAMPEMYEGNSFDFFSPLNPNTGKGTTGIREGEASPLILVSLDLLLRAFGVRMEIRIPASACAGQPCTTVG